VTNQRFEPDGRVLAELVTIGRAVIGSDLRRLW